MDLICYLHPGWTPLVRPAPAARAWMDDTPEAFAYRCLPLNIANAHGWEVLSSCGFQAVWDGGRGVEAVTIALDAGADSQRAPVSLFGQGVLTFHVEGLFRTPPGWDLMVGGSPNRFKDGLAPLTGVIEADWSPYSFTMNWRFTRPHAPVRFEAGEPFCFLFPLQRGALEAFAPRFAPVADDPGLERRFTGWSRSRDAFHEQMAKAPPAAPADKWQKHYYRGVDFEGQSLIEDHKAKLRLKPFDRAATPAVPAAPAGDPPIRAPGADEASRLRLSLAKREWLLEAVERQRALSPTGAGIERRDRIDGEEFLERYYAPGRPVILTGEMAGWPALDLWTPNYLKAKVGAAPVDYQGERSADPRFERDKDAHRRTAPFDAFMDAIARPGAGNDAYITAYNSQRNRQALSVLDADLGAMDALLDPSLDYPKGMMWIGPQGTFTALHHDLTNNLIAQVVGSKRLKILPASEVGRLYNDEHVFSGVPDLEDTALDLQAHPRLVGARIYEVVLAPGEALFLPFGWWHQVRALSFSVTLTYTNFRWPNDAHASYPAG